MQEEPVFWLGGQPPGGLGARRNIAEDEKFEAAVRQACEVQGFGVENYVCALGPYGSWLAEIRREGRQHRVVWDGRQQQLILQEPLTGGGWRDLDASPVEYPGPDKLIAGIGDLLHRVAPQPG